MAVPKAERPSSSFAFDGPERGVSLVLSNPPLRPSRDCVEAPLGDPFHVLATRYSCDNCTSPDALTLVLTHSLVVHMETWDITIAHLFKLQSADPSSRVKIREIFSVESPNHGRSAQVNAEELVKNPLNDWTREYSRAVQRFLVAQFSPEKRIDSAPLNLVGISHSFGAAALFIAAESIPSIRFKAMITFEPGMTAKDHPYRHRSNQAAVAWAWLRPDVWRSRKAARKELAASPMYSSWDPRVFDLFIENGLIDHPGAKDPPPYTFPGVTTALSKVHHARSFQSDDLMIDGINSYAAVTRKIPVHVVWGSIHELANQELKDFMSDARAGRTPVSVSYIEGASHMVIQQKPEEAAEMIYSLLTTPLHPPPLSHL
ncbi:Alpha/beta hydrolase family-domain-containing protein [Mycena belliarum]|uniref:Alpha/beta hydrolase family-domain-containing protein n=1 Tax=Mycena belliarum TaxID=1033014 RepID=A0AAD6XWW4_9AGAR|nr:Alpha/beta hydrolase family-domain-containing protein [Mycena belliae]